MSKRKTQEEFERELNNINSNIIVLGKYINSDTKIKCKCLIDEHEWENTPYHLLSGQGCPKCKGVLKYTTFTFQQEINKKFDNISIISEYRNSKTPILLKCEVDNYIWEQIPTTFLKGKGCPKCNNREPITEEIFLSRITNPNVEILDKYINTVTPIKCRCKIDGYEWYVKPAKLFIGHGCPKCANLVSITHEDFIDEILKTHPDLKILSKYCNSHTKIKYYCNIHKQSFEGTSWQIRGLKTCCPMGGRELADKQRNKTHEEFVNKMELINPNIEFLEKYEKAQKKILCKCKIDGTEWSATPNKLLVGTGCPVCKNKIISKKQAMSNDEFLDKLTAIHGDDIIPLEPYFRSHKKIKCKCAYDGNIWNVIPNSLLNGTGCPKHHDSRLQKKVDRFLKENNIQFNREFNCSLIPKNPKTQKVMPFDIEIVDNKILLEIDGEQHDRICGLTYHTAKRNNTTPEEEYHKRKLYDRYKQYVAYRNGYKVIRISWALDDKEQSYKDYLKSQLISYGVEFNNKDA